MAITLRHLGTQAVLALPDRLLWTNEYAWSPVAHEARWGTTGALMLHVAARQAGRPIELDGQLSEAWLDRATCAQLHAWAAAQGQRFELTLRGQARTVVFDHASGGPAFEAEPLWPLLDSEHGPQHMGELLYRPRFRFMEV